MTGERVLSPLVSLMTTGALLALTLANIGLAQVELHGWNALVALLIAAVQAIVMVVVFMRLRWSPPLTRLWAASGVVWLAILMVGTLDDVLTRAWLATPGK